MIYEPNVPLEPISSVAWDPLEEALWTGTSMVWLLDVTIPMSLLDTLVSFGLFE
jgi:hypothetical protein